MTSISGHTRSVVTPKFRDRLARLKDGFGAAYRFLTDLGADRIPDFRISTDKNAHLYYSKNRDDQNDFYAYIVLKPEERAIDLISRPNKNYWGKPATKSEFLFGPKLDALVSELDGRHRWAIPEALGYTLTYHTPPEFFERLLGLIREVHK